jgi:hypothetical protein
VDFLRQWIGILLILAGLARAGVVVLHEPMVGYANQYDMHRTSACIGLFPANEAAAQVGTPEAPISLYSLGARTDGCYQSAEVAIAATAVAIARAAGVTPSRFHLQWVGYVKLALLFGTAFLLAWLLRDHAGASVVHGLAVLLVLSDPVVTLWMNTLYTEFATIWSLYAFIGAASVLALYDRQSLLAWALLVVSLVVLAFSREQFALLGPALVLAAWPWLWHSSNRLTVTAFAITLVATFVGLYVLPRPVQVAKANRADTYLNLLVPSSSSPARGLAILGLPDTCEPVVGASWYRQHGESLDKACPKVYSLSSFSFLRFASEEPHALARAAARALPVMQGVAPTYLGVLEGQRGKAIGELPWWAFSPLHALDTAIPASVFVVLTLATFVLAPLGLVALVAMRRWRGDPLAPLMLAMLLGGTAIYSFLTTIFGDGINEGARHYLPGALAMYVALLAAIAGLAWLAMRWKETPKEALLELGVGAVALALGVYGCFVAMDWIGAQPAAIGVLDQPAGRQVAAGGVQLRGWALDPSGVEAVRARVGTLERSARIGEASPVLGMLRVAAIHFGYPDAARAGFILDLSGEDLAKAGAPNPLTLRVLVQGKNGAVTEIDRRNLEFAGTAAAPAAPAASAEPAATQPPK